MDQSCSESDISLSPSRILERLQILRQVQLLQQGKLQYQQLHLSESPGSSSGIAEIISHLSNTTSYNTFQSLLQTSQESLNNESQRSMTSNVKNQLCEKDLLDGVTVLNISQESEFIINTPTSARSKLSVRSRQSETSEKSEKNFKQIALDEMPILSPKHNFEELILEKLEKENPKIQINTLNTLEKPKKQFLKKGEGMARFGVKKNDLVIQTTKSLPWRRDQKGMPLNNNNINKLRQPPTKMVVISNKDNDKVTPSLSRDLETNTKDLKTIVETKKNIERPTIKVQEKKLETITDETSCEIHNQKRAVPRKPLKAKHPLITNKGKTWAAVLTKEQDEFLRHLKQSEYYKNFNSPTKSIVSNISYDETLNNLRLEREIAERNMFELIENKVTNESFNLENSFFNKFLNKNQLECSGESTPVVLQKCLSSNPNLMHILPNFNKQNQTEVSVTDDESECSNCPDCCNRNCPSPSTCSTCQTDDTIQDTTENFTQSSPKKSSSKKVSIKTNMPDKSKDITDQSHVDNVSTKEMKANMEEMNAKLIATSELLKERLQELEDEIETFRKENANLVKMREEFDQEKLKFFEEKSSFEHKLNEEKILSEYFLAEEKERLTKQKQLYEKYVREMRGRLNKKEKDEVVNLKKEISNLKDEIRIKDAKSTSTIARLRNQLKIMEKEKKDLQEEVEKLKKTNKRIQHSNDITRRVSNMKYLAEINKKLSEMSSKDTQSDVHLDKDIKYKAFEIERQSRGRKLQTTEKRTVRPRAKSVPNLNVTSRYAKYFSQKDSASHMDNITSLGNYSNESDNESGGENLQTLDDADTLSNHDSDHSEESNELEKLYMERFQNISPKSNRSSLTNSLGSERTQISNTDTFFIRKSVGTRTSTSPSGQQKNTPPTYTNFKTSGNGFGDGQSIINSDRSKSPVSRISNPSGTVKNSMQTVIDAHSNRISLTPEPTNKADVSKTNLNPTEIKKSDGSREIRFSNGNVKFISADGKYCKFVYYNGDIKENFFSDGRIKYFYAETKTLHTTYPDGLEVLEFADGQVEKRYKDGSSEIRLPNGSVRYHDPKNEHVREEWRFPDGTTVTVSANGEQRVVFSNGQVEVHAKDHKRREFPDGTVKLVYNDGTAETRYASGRIRIKDKHGNLIMDSDNRR